MTKLTQETHEIDHAALMSKLVEHEGKFVILGRDIHGINQKLDPIAAGVQSMAHGFKLLLMVGAASAAVVGIMELVERFG